MPERREKQLAYSERQALMLDEPGRRAKAAKIAAVVQHFLGVPTLDGLTVVDVGCSGGIIASELAIRGARVIGIDIDIPGLAKARAEYGDQVGFLCADSERMPFANGSVDVLVCNHVYEHVVDPDRLFAELRRVVKPSGVIYLGLGNRLGVIEPHYRLPLLSWLPRSLAHRYVRATRRADHYHEAFKTRLGLKRLCAGLCVWDYTYAVLGDARRFAANDVVPELVTRIPPRLLRLALPLIPTYIWVATPQPSHPAGQATRFPPHLVAQASTPAASNSAAV
jgi:2-polyprenyl-3-methyl-5-hydroxy-6-metoxy-1,4-benzoquinol methylase